MIFFEKREMANKGPKKGKEDWFIKNNGIISFPCSEVQKMGIDRKRFLRAIDQLIDHGFIEITRQGGGMCRIENLYALTGNWRKWNKPDFVKTERKIRKRTQGFCLKEKTKTTPKNGTLMTSNNAQKWDTYNNASVPKMGHL